MGRNQKENYERYGGYNDTRQGNSQRRNPNMSSAYMDDRYAVRRTAGNSGYAGGGGTQRQRTNDGYAGGNGAQRQNVNGSYATGAQRQNPNGRNGNSAQRQNTNRTSQNAYRTQNRNTSGRNTGGSKRRRRRRKRTSLFICLFLVLLLLLGCAAGVWFLSKKEVYSNAPEVTVSIDSLDSPYAVLIDKATGDVMASKNGDEIIYPASTTKILTVLTAIEHISNLDSTITMSYDYYDALYAQDATRAGFEPGEEAVIRDLLYGALLPSGAECCMELAIQAAGSEDAFAELMNQKVAELGLTQSHFTNCTGLHNDNQYTTPHEMALILQEALKNKTFREVFTTHYYTVDPTNVHPDGFTFWSSMFKNMQAETVIGGEILGGKTGFTQAAGYCLASMAEVEEREYILVTAGWASNPRTTQYHINDAFLGYNALGRALAEAKEK